MDEGAAFGFFPQLRPRRRLQDPTASADVPFQVLRGRLAGLLGLPSDIGNLIRSPQPMEAFGSYDYEQPQQLPYTTEQFLKELPLAPTAPVGQLAGQAASFVPLNPAPLVRGVQKVGTMVGEGMAERVATGRPMLPSLLAEPPSAMFAVEPNVPRMNLLSTSRESFVPGVEAGKELIVHHNITPQKLANVEKVGGMPVPSIAVSNVENPMMGFGNISLIGSKEMAIPSAKNPVYGFDAYTARAPKIDYQIDQKSKKALEAQLKDIADEIPDGSYGVDRLINNWEDRKYSDVLYAKFLKDEGYGLPNISDFKEKPWKYRSEISQRVSNLKGEYQDWLNNFERSLPEAGVNIKERIFKGFTDSGNRRYAPVTLENLVKEMKGGAGSEGFFYGVGNIRAVATPKFKNLNQVKAARENIISSEEFEPIKKQINGAFDDLTERLNKLEGKSGYGYEAPDALYEIGQTRNVNLLDKIYKDVPESLKADVQIFMNKVTQMPTEYFEIKPQRAVQVGEFKGAILPSDVPSQSVDYLKSQGLQDLYYYSTPEERKELFKKFGPEMFGILPVSLLAEPEIQQKLTDELGLLN